jgi:hypothetical protein
MATKWVPGVLSLGVKRPGREADHSPPSSAEVKNARSYTSIPPLRLHGVVEHRDNFTFTFTVSVKDEEFLDQLRDYQLSASQEGLYSVEPVS